MNGKLDWTIGAFYMEHDIENHIRGYRDNNLDGEIMYECRVLLQIPSCYDHDYGIPGRFDVFGAEWIYNRCISRERLTQYMVKQHIVLEMIVAPSHRPEIF